MTLHNPTYYYTSPPTHYQYTGIRRPRDENLYDCESFLPNKKQCLEHKFNGLSISSAPFYDHDEDLMMEEEGIFHNNNEYGEMDEETQTEEDPKNVTIEIDLEQIIPALDLRELVQNKDIYVSTEIESILRDRLSQVCSNQLYPSLMDRIVDEFMLRLQYSSSIQRGVPDTESPSRELITYNPLTLLRIPLTRKEKTNEVKKEEESTRFEIIEDHERMDIE